MTGKEIIDLIMGRCNRTAPEFRVKVLAELTLVQVDRLEKRPQFPDWLIGEQSDALTTAGESRLYLPLDFIQEVEDMNLVFVEEDTGAESDMDRKGWDELITEYPGVEPGVPRAYTVRGNYLYLKPTPDAEYRIRFPGYYAKQDLPIDDATFHNAWTDNAPNLMIGLTGMVMAAQYLKDMELAQSFATIARDANAELDVYITATQEANRTRRMG